MKKFMALFLAMVMIIPMVVSADTYVNGDWSDLNTVSTSSTREYLLTSDSCTSLGNSGGKTVIMENSSYVIYTIPLPELNEEQLFEEFSFSCTLYAKKADEESTVKDMTYIFKLPQTINFGTLKLNDVSEYLNRDNVNSYPAYDSINFEQQVAAGSGTGAYSFWRVTADITGYANECLANDQDKLYLALTLDKGLVEESAITDSTSYFRAVRKGTAATTVNGVEHTVKAQYSFTPSVEYKAYAPLVVSSDASLDNASYESAVSSEIAVGSPFKTAFKIANNTGNDKALKLVFACYTSANELVGLVFEDATAYTGSTAVLTSSALKLPATTSYVKAFVMDANNNPVTTFAKVNVATN